MNNIDENNLVVKSNALINAMYHLSIQEQRILLILISKVDSRTDKEFKLFQIPVELFKKIVGVEGEGYYDKLKDVTKNLLKRVVDIPRPKGGLLQISWLASCEYIPQNGCVELEISEKLKPYLLELQSHFTAYRLKMILPLQSSYSIRIYELLKQYEKLRERYFELSELRNKLGIADTEYILYGNFKQRVLLQAQKELPEITDITFEFKEKKLGRRVIGVLFFIRSNIPSSSIEMVVFDDKAVSENEILDSIEDVNLYMRLQSFGILPTQAKGYLHKFKGQLERLNGNLDYVEQIIKKGIPIKNIGAYTVKAIEMNYQIQKTIIDIAKEKQIKAEEERKAKEFHQKKREELKQNFDEETTQLAVGRFEQLSLTQQAQMIEAFESSMNSFTKKKYLEAKKNIESSIFVKSAYHIFLKNHLLSEDESNFDLWLESRHP